VWYLADLSERSAVRLTSSSRTRSVSISDIPCSLSHYGRPFESVGTCSQIKKSGSRNWQAPHDHASQARMMNPQSGMSIPPSRSPQEPQMRRKAGYGQQISDAMPPVSLNLHMRSREWTKEARPVGVM
jgi:hypothetical protein